MFIVGNSQLNIEASRNGKLVLACKEMICDESTTIYAEKKLK
jgi:hypothetical protein